MIGYHLVTIGISPDSVPTTMWELVSFAKADVRRRCISILKSGPNTPSGISEKTGVHLSHVSRSLRELCDKGLVECLTPKATKNRIYRITDKGKKVLTALEGLS